MSPEAFIDAVKSWALSRSDLRALALVGSHARGQATATSDIDLVLVPSRPAAYLDDTAWLSTFGAVTTLITEDWGKVQSLRARYEHGVEAEFGVASRAWTEFPPDPETAKVLKDGVLVLFDRDGAVSRMVEHVRRGRSF